MIDALQEWREAKDEMTRAQQRLEAAEAKLMEPPRGEKMEAEQPHGEAPAFELIDHREKRRIRIYGSGKVDGLPQPGNWSIINHIPALIASARQKITEGDGS